jgi:hypothetical protein
MVDCRYTAGFCNSVLVCEHVNLWAVLRRFHYSDEKREREANRPKFLRFPIMGEQTSFLSMYTLYFLRNNTKNLGVSQDRWGIGLSSLRMSESCECRYEKAKICPYLSGTQPTITFLSKSFICTLSYTGPLVIVAGYSLYESFNSNLQILTYESLPLPTHPPIYVHSNQGGYSGSGIVQICTITTALLFWVEFWV